jgi:RNA processing factor Prp31
VSLEQSEAFEQLDQTTQLILRKLREDSQRIEDKLDKGIRSDENICDAISQLKHTNTSGQADTKSAISKQIDMQMATDATKHDSVVGRLDGVHSDILKALVSVAADNRAEHNVTRAEIQRVTDMKVEHIRKELFGSRSGHGEVSAASAIRIGNVAPVELQKLQNGALSNSVLGWSKILS